MQYLRIFLGEQPDPDPTDAQKKAGNYRKDHVSRHGFEISIENAKGQQRSGKDKDGHEWSVTMTCDYGYIKGTRGRDKDHLDAFLGPDEESDKVYVVNQVDKAGDFDEHKVVFGCHNADEAKKLYLSNFEDGWKTGPIKAMSVEEFKAWIENGDMSKQAESLGYPNEWSLEITPLNYWTTILMSEPALQRQFEDMGARICRGSLVLVKHSAGMDRIKTWLQSNGLSWRRHGS